MDKFLTSNETSYRLARTILQGIIGVLMANLDVIFTALRFTSADDGRSISDYGSDQL